MEFQLRKKKKSCKLGLKKGKKIQTKQLKNNMMQQAMQQILVSTFLSKKTEKEKKIKLSITWTVIHSQWAFCIQLYISKTSYLIRNELDWCKNTGLLRSKVFTHVLVRMGQKQNACFSKWRRESYTLTAWCTAVNPDTGDREDVFVLLENVETKESFHDEWRKVTSVLCCHLVFLLEKNPKIKILLEKKSTIATYYTLTFLIIYPVFKIREIPASSATSESASESRWSTAGGPERTSAGHAASASPRRHEASATETSSSPILSQRDAESLRIHPSLFRPGWPPLPVNRWRKQCLIRVECREAHLQNVHIKALCSSFKITTSQEERLTFLYYVLTVLI